MKKAILIAVTVAATAGAFEYDSLNLITPTGIGRRDAVLEIQHRLYGNLAEPAAGDTLLTAGANVGIGVRYAILQGLEIKPYLYTSQKEFGAALSYGRPFGKVGGAQMNVQFFDYELAGVDERRRNFFYAAALQGGPWRGFAPVINAAYDAYEEKAGFAGGIRFGGDVTWGPIKNAALLAEYYPVVDRTARSGETDAWAAGAEFQTYGHHFALSVSNTAALGTRRMMLGAPTDSMHVGFNIYRWVDL